MTEPDNAAEPATTESTRREPTAPDPPAADLLDVVTAVPGVHAVEPGLGTALRTLDARVRRTGSRTARFGLHIDTADGTALIEVCLDRSRPIRETVQDIQVALRRALDAGAGALASPGSDSVPATATAPEVTVRVQSLQR